MLRETKTVSQENTTSARAPRIWLVAQGKNKNRTVVPKWLDIAQLVSRISTKKGKIVADAFRLFMSGETT